MSEFERVGSMEGVQFEAARAPRTFSSAFAMMWPQMQLLGRVQHQNTQTQSGYILDVLIHVIHV